MADKKDKKNKIDNKSAYLVILSVLVVAFVAWYVVDQFLF